MHARLTLNLLKDIGNVILEIGIFRDEHRLSILLDSVKVTGGVDAAVIQDAVAVMGRFNKIYTCVISDAYLLIA